MTELISIQVDDRAVRAALQRLGARLADLSPAMADIAQALESETEANFESESGPGGGWAALADSTIARRIKAGKWPGKMLQMTAGGLAASIESRHGRDFAEIGSNKVYAAIHQFGGQAGRGRKVTIPARPYLPISAAGELTDAARATILERLQWHLDQAT